MRADGAPPRWADLLLTLWVLVVALVYFGGYFWPDAIGPYTNRAAAVYAVMLLVSVAVLTGDYLKRERTPREKSRQDARTKPRK